MSYSLELILDSVSADGDETRQKKRENSTAAAGKGEENRTPADVEKRAKPITFRPKIDEEIKVRPITSHVRIIYYLLY